MPFRFEFDSTHKILMVRFEGRVTDEMVEAYYRVEGPKILASLEFKGSIVDFTDVTSMELSPGMVRGLAWLKPMDMETERPRIIVAPSPHAYGLARMFASHGEDTRPSLHVVRSMEQACAMLGMVHSDFKPIG